MWCVVQHVQNGLTFPDGAMSPAPVSSNPENSHDSSRSVSPQNKQLLTMGDSGAPMSVLSQFDHIRSLLGVRSELASCVLTVTNVNTVLSSIG